MYSKNCYILCDPELLKFLVVEIQETFGWIVLVLGYYDILSSFAYTQSFTVSCMILQMARKDAVDLLSELRG